MNHNAFQKLQRCAILAASSQIIAPWPAYISPFLNLYLVWNTGIGFGLASLQADFVYHILTVVIAMINLILIIILLKSKGIYEYLFAIILQ